jgi:hypothetical protein
MSRVKQKRYNKFYIGDKVTIVSQTYVWGIVEDVYLRHGKITYKVVIQKGGKKLLNKLPEEALLPFVRKWQWKILRFFGIII